MPYDPRRVAGSVLKYSTTSGGTYTTIPGVKGFKQSNAQAEEIDITAIDDTVKRKLAGLTDQGTFTFQLVFDPQDTVHIAAKTAYDAGTKWFFRYSINAATARRFAFSGTFRQFNYSGDTGQPHLVDVELLVDGAVTLEADA